MTKRVGRVTGVYVVNDTNSPNNGQTLVNVDPGPGADGLPGVVNALPSYYPQNGDKVVVEDIGGGVWIVTGDLTPNRGYAASVQPVVVEVQNTAPDPAAYTQVSAQYFTSGQFSQPKIILVPTTEVVPPPPSGGTLVQAAAAGHSYRYDFGGSWSDTNGRIYQGQYGGFGPWAGLWFYPDLVTPLTGHTVTGGSIHLHRAGWGGSAGAVQLHFYLHNHATQPAGEPTLTGGPADLNGGALSRNGSADVALPLGWVQALAAGTAKGVGIYATDQDSYSILLGPDEDASSGQLSITYS